MIRILLIEDDPLIIEMYDRAFKLNNFEVELAKEGREALDKLAEMKKKPDVILLDIMMPKMNGFEVLEHMRTMPEVKDIPVLVLTNLSAGKESGAKALELGAHSFLIKSEYSIKEIVERIREIVSESKKSIAE